MPWRYHTTEMSEFGNCANKQTLSSYEMNSSFSSCCHLFGQKFSGLAHVMNDLPVCGSAISPMYHSFCALMTAYPRLHLFTWTAAIQPAPARGVRPPPPPVFILQPMHHQHGLHHPGTAAKTRMTKARSASSMSACGSVRWHERNRMRRARYESSR